MRYRASALLMVMALSGALSSAAEPAAVPSAGPVEAGPRLGGLAAGQTPIITWAELQKQLEAPKDDIVLIDFWATWCIPCIAALPDMAALAKEYQGKHVRVVLVSFDDAEDADKVRERLKQSGVEFGSYILKAEDREKVVDAMHPDWKNIALPASFVYDRAGKQAYHELFKTQTAKEWGAVLDPLIKVASDK